MALAPAAPMMPPPGAAPPEMSMAGGDMGGSPVLVTICGNDDGTYTVYSGDEPEEGGEGVSEDDADAMGDAGDQAAPEGQQAASVGEALKMAMDILNEAKGAEGAPEGGDAEDQFSAGFGAPAGGAPMQQKY